MIFANPLGECALVNPRYHPEVRHIKLLRPITRDETWSRFENFVSTIETYEIFFVVFSAIDSQPHVKRFSRNAGLGITQKSRKENH
jgi:hypothetical protein